MPASQPDRNRSGCANAIRSGFVGKSTKHEIDGEPGQVGADTVVGTGAAEADVRVGISQDVESERVVEDGVVEVGRSIGQHNALALLDLHPGKIHIGQCCSLEGCDRRGPPNDLIRALLGPLGFEQLPLVWVIEECHHPLGDGIAGGFITGHRQGDEKQAELFVGEFLAVDIGSISLVTISSPGLSALCAANCIP